MKFSIYEEIENCTSKTLASRLPMFMVRRYDELWLNRAPITDPKSNIRFTHNLQWKFDGPKWMYYYAKLFYGARFIVMKD